MVTFTARPLSTAVKFLSHSSIVAELPFEVPKISSQYRILQRTVEQMFIAPVVNNCPSGTTLGEVCGIIF